MARVDTLFRRYQAKGDVGALAKVFDRTAAQTLRVAMHFARDPNQAEAWVQETYLIAIERADRWDAARPFVPWLLGILRNVVRRAHAARSTVPLPDEPLVALPVPDDVAQLSWSTEVAKAVDNLSDPYRAVLVLRFQHGLAPAEIATLHDVPAATVRSQIHRGLTTLRSRLPARERAHVGVVLPLGLAAIRTRVCDMASQACVTAMQPTAATTAVTTLGGLAMQKVLWGAAALALLAFFVTDPLGLRDTASPPAATPDDDVLTSQAPALKTPPKALRAPIDTGEDVDLAQVDRTRDLHGIVVLASGAPVSGATVRLDDVPWRTSMVDAHLGDVGVPLATTTTGPRGTFRLRLDPGTRGRLTVTASGHPPRQVWMASAGERVRVVLDDSVTLSVRVLAPDASPAAGVAVRLWSRSRGYAVHTTDGEGHVSIRGQDPEARISVSAIPQREGWGVSTHHRVQLPAKGTHAFTIHLPKGRTIRGTVTDATTGRPIEGAHIGMGWTRLGAVTSDADGRYVLHGWTGDGFRELGVAAPGYVHGKAPVPSDVDRVDIALPPGARLRGRVVGPTQAPVAGAYVSIVGSVHDGRTQTLTMGQARTEEDGTFVVEGLRSDMPLLVQVRARGHARRLVDIDALNAREATMNDIELPPPLVLDGLVVHADGRPASRMSVRLVGANADRAHLRAGQLATRHYGTREDIVTDDLGRFVVSDLCAGEFKVQVEARRPYVTDTVTLTPDQALTTLKLVVPPLRTIRVRVIGPDGEPFNRGMATAVYPDGQTKQMVDSDGGATLVVPTSVTAIRYHPMGARDIVVPDPAPVTSDQDDIEIHVHRAATIEGVVVTPDGKPLSGVLVAAYVGTHRRGDTAMTDKDGAFVLKCEEARVNLRLESVHRPSAPPKAYVGEVRDVRAGARDVRIQARSLDGTERLVVRVLGPDGPLEGLVCLLMPPQPSGGMSRTDAQGRAVFEGLAAIERTVKAFGRSKDGTLWAEHVVNATPGGSEVVIAMQPPLILRGRVLLPDGQPAQGAMLMLRTDDDEARVLTGGQTPPDGTFQLPVGQRQRLRLQATKVIDNRVYEAVHILDDIPTDDVVLRLVPKK